MVNIEESIMNKLFQENKPCRKEDYSNLLAINNFSKNSFYFETLTDNEFFDFVGAKQEFVDFYKKIIKTKVGTIILGGIYLGLNDKNKYSRISLEEEIMSKYKQIVKISHSFNCKIYLKVKSAYGRFNELYNINNSTKIASNFGFDPSNKQKLLIRASDEKCNEIVNDFARCVMLSSIARFDGIVIDATYDNLIGELSSEVYNKRIFGYFSDTKDLLTKMLKSVKASNNTIILKLSIDPPLFNNPKNAKEVKNFQNFIIKLKDDLKYYVNLGVDGFEFIFGDNLSNYLNNFNPFEGELLFCEFVTAIREYFNSNNLKNKFGEEIVIFYHDNFNSISSANNLVKNKVINFIDITKNLYSDVNFINNLINKKPSLNCIKCSYCIKKAQFNSKNQCLINPSFSQYKNLQLNGNGKCVAVVGSGISGLICSLTLAKRGYIVHLYEQNNELNLIGKLTTVYGFDRLLLNFYNSIEDKVMHKVSKNKIIIFNQKFDTNIPEFKKYYSIILATGFNKKFLSISGAVQSHVYNIYDALENIQLFDNKKNIVIYAKSILSLKLALWLSKIKNNITIIIKNIDWLKEDKSANLFYFFWNLYQKQTSIYFLSRITKINDDNIDLFYNKNFNEKSIDTFYKIISNAKIKFDQRLINLDCDLIIYEPDISPNNKLYVDIVQSGYAGEVYLIGNALENTDLAEIIKSGYFVGNNL